MQDEFPIVVNVDTLGGTFRAGAERKLPDSALNALREGPNQMGPGMQKKQAEQGAAAPQAPVVK